MAEHAHTTSPRRRALLAGTGLAAAVTLLTRKALAAPTPAAAQGNAPLCSRDELIDRYDAWLHAERRMLMVEKYGIEHAAEAEQFIPADRHAALFHYPPVPGGWTTVPKPSTRAAAVLGQVGVFLGPDAATPPALATTHPDAELLALAADYVALDREICRRCDAVADMVKGDPEYDAYFRWAGPVVDRLQDMEDELAGMRAVTAEGLRAQALAALHVMSGNADRVMEPMDDAAAVAWAVCAAVAGRV